MLVFAALLFLAVACGAPDGSRGSGELPPQRGFVTALDKARRALFQGDVEYDDLRDRRLRVGEPIPFLVTVSGSWKASPNGKPDTPMPTGAEMGVRFACHGDADCTSDSSSLQPVLTRQDRVPWTCWITPHAPGPLTVSVTVTAYYTNTSTVLVKRTIDVRTHTEAPPRSFFATLWDRLRTGWGVFVAFTTGVGAVWGTWSLVVGAVRRLRRPRATGEDPSAPTPEDAAPTADGTSGAQ
ncbi:hypothetical protein [Streptomyces sp. NPDC001222]|uniref:hypothetical protein n=1 Tax=Streptomyces sp. NPDC001222 TaxID=3364548 RepID=UPI0036CD202D